MHRGGKDVAPFPPTLLADSRNGGAARPEDRGGRPNGIPTSLEFPSCRRGQAHENLPCPRQPAPPAPPPRPGKPSMSLSHPAGPLIYVRTYVFTYVRTYVRTYVCTYVRTYVRRHGGAPYLSAPNGARVTKDARRAGTAGTKGTTGKGEQAQRNGRW